MDREIQTLRAYLKVDLDAIKSNYEYIRECTKAKICCVVKSNAYGHGMIELSHLYDEMGADYFAVSNIEEAVQLRIHKIKAPILILGYTPPVCAGLISKYDISQCVYSKEYADALYRQASKEDLHIKIHLKLDTGMGRIGFLCRDQSHNQLEQAWEAARLDRFITEGIFTHFATTDDGPSGREYAFKQYQNFMQGVSFLESRGIRFQVKHCGNSAVITDYPELHMDMVRAGSILYGLQPVEDDKRSQRLKRSCSLVSVISNVKMIYPGESVGYSRGYIATEERKIATIPIGFADGIPRKCANENISVSFHQKQVPVVGQVCMNQLMIDVTGLECSIGDEVLIWGNDDIDSADNIAQCIDTIVEEVICNISRRVPRVYISDGKAVSISEQGKDSYRLL